MLRRQISTRQKRFFSSARPQLNPVSGVKANDNPEIRNASQNGAVPKLSTQGAINIGTAVTQHHIEQARTTPPPWRSSLWKTQKKASR